VERELAEIAGRQHGIVARSQVEALGHGAITQRGRWMAAVLASGPGAVLSHQSATALWGIWGSGTGEVHVTVPRNTGSRWSIRRHRGDLPRDEVAVREGIPVTSAARAVLDLAVEKGEASAEAALREMEYLRVFGPVSLPVLLDRYPRHRGTPIVRICLERLSDDPVGRVRSPLEEVFLPFLDAHHIPRPRLNAWLSVDAHRYQVDCLWPDVRLVAELDGFKSHGTKRAFRKDRKRDRRLGAHGFHVIRITEDQLLDEPSEVAADLASLLSLSGSAPVTVTAREDRDRGRLRQSIRPTDNHP
jgi:hypothetical protein